MCNQAHIYDNSKNNAHGVLSPLIIFQNGRVALLDKNCPQYLKDVLMGLK